MSKRVKLIITGAGIAALVAIPLTVNALAATPTPVNPGTAGGSGQYYCGYSGGYYLDTVSTLLGLTPVEIQTQLQSGKSLVDIAATKGITENALIDAILTPMKQQMQQMVTAGVLTQVQADQRIQFMTPNLKQVVETKGLTAAQSGYGMMGNGGMMNGTNGTGWGGMMRGWSGTPGTAVPNGVVPDRGGMMGGGGMMGRW